MIASRLAIAADTPAGCIFAISPITPPRLRQIVSRQLSKMISRMAIEYFIIARLPLRIIIFAAAALAPVPLISPPSLVFAAAALSHISLSSLISILFLRPLITIDRLPLSATPPLPALLIDAPPMILPLTLPSISRFSPFRLIITDCYAFAPRHYCRH